MEQMDIMISFFILLSLALRLEKYGSLHFDQKDSEGPTKNQMQLNW